MDEPSTSNRDPTGEGKVVLTLDDLISPSLEELMLSKNKKPQDRDSDVSFKDLKSKEKELPRRPNALLPEDPKERESVLRIVKALMDSCKLENGFDWEFNDGVKFMHLVKNVYTKNIRGYFLFLHLVGRYTKMEKSLEEAIEEVKILFRYDPILFLEFNNLLPPSLRMDVSHAQAEAEAQVKVQVAEAQAKVVSLRNNAIQTFTQLMDVQAEVEAQAQGVELSLLTVEDVKSFADLMTHFVSPEEYGALVDTLEDLRAGRVTEDMAMSRLGSLINKYPGLIGALDHMFRKALQVRAEAT